MKSIKLPFGNNGNSLADPVDDEYEEDYGEEEYEYEDEDEEGGPISRLRPWFMVGAAYLMTVAAVAGIYLYLDSNADQIEQEALNKRPTQTVESLSVNGDKPQTLQNDVAAAMQAINEPSQNATAPSSELDSSLNENNITAIDQARLEKEAKDKELEENALAAFQTPNDAAEIETSNQNTTIPQATARNADGTVALLPHPDPSLIEQTTDGPLPRTGVDGRRPWQVYAKPSNSFENRPKMSIIMMNLGLSKQRTNDAFKLPSNVTLAFAPYASNLTDLVDQARRMGHEVMLTLPMEPIDFPKSDPGPYALYTTLDEQQNLKKLNWILSRTTGYIGFISYQGTKYVASNSHMNFLGEQLGKRGLIYMDSVYTPVSTSQVNMNRNNVPYLNMDMILDERPDRGSIQQKLKQLEDLARSRGRAVAVAHPYKSTIQQINTWWEKTENKDLALVPISSLVNIDQ